MLDTADDFAFLARIVKRLLKNANATSCRRHRRMALSILHWTLARSRAPVIQQVACSLRFPSSDS